jgi:nicotinate-nucleotide adenylyltransferase
LTSEQNQIGVLGGTFDPIHNGHLHLARQIKETFHLDQILFLPAYIPPHKQDHPVTPAHHRLAMLQLAIREQANYAISLIELDRKGTSFAIDTLHALKANNPGQNFHWVMGSDTFREFPTWKDYLEVARGCHILVGLRPGHPLTKTENLPDWTFVDGEGIYSAGKEEADRLEFTHRQSGTRLAFFNMPPKEVSSSEIREKISSNQEIKNLLPAEVENYIIENHLYRK